MGLLRLARTVGHTPRRERAVRRFSRLGEHGALWLLLGSAGAVADRRERRAWGEATAGVLFAFGLNSAIKLVVRRPRPRLADLPPLTGTPTGLSFPSAHATTSFAAACLYRRRGLPAAPLGLLAAGLASSRLYLGVHYPSDVLAGVALGEGVGRCLSALMEADGGPAPRDRR